MRVTRLHVNNFGCYADRQFEFDKPLTVIIGLNNAGKSTILDAIQWVMTGRCRGLDGGGKGVKAHLLHKGATSEAVGVTANIVFKGETYAVSRTFQNGNSGFSVERFGERAQKWQGGTEDQEKAWFELLGVTREGLMALLDAETFLRMEHADAKSLLLGFLKPEVTLPGTGEIISVVECERRHDAAYSQRTSINRDFKRAVKPVQPANDPEPRTLEQVREIVAGRQDERDEAIKALANLPAHDRSVADQKASLEKQLDTAKKLLGSEPEGGWDAYIGKKNDELAAATAAADEARASAEGDHSINFERIGKHEPEKGCVLHPDIPCKTSPREFLQFVKKRQPKTTPSELAKALKDKDAAEDALRGARESEKQYLARKAKIEGIEEQLSALADKAFEADPDVEKRREDIQATIDTLERKIAKGHEVIERKVKLAKDVEVYERDAKKYEELEYASRQVEADVELYGPKGIRLAALEKAKGEWVSSINTVLEPFGYELSLSLDPWGLIVNGQPTARLSTSERLRVCIAIQLAMASLSGVGLVLVDSLDWLLKAPRQILMQVVSAMKDDVEQVIICKAQDPEVPMPKGASVQVINLSA